MPADVPAKKLKSILNDKISKGDVNIGTLIVPQIFEKTSVKDGHLVTEEVKTEGCKIKLLETRQKVLNMQKKYMCLHTGDEVETMARHIILMFLQKHKVTCSEEDLTTLSELQELLKNLERARYLMFWHDGLTVSKHSHIMMMFSCIYDEAAFLTNDEYEAINGTPVSIQLLIEKPFIYMLARCPSDDHQLLYSPERLNDTTELKHRVEYNGIYITGIMCTFKGDNPASQLESGQQKNADYFC